MVLGVCVVALPEIYTLFIFVSILNEIDLGFPLIDWDCIVILNIIVDLFQFVRNDKQVVLLLTFLKGIF